MALLWGLGWHHARGWGGPWSLPWEPCLPVQDPLLNHTVPPVNPYPELRESQLHPTGSFS